ncbi:DUF1961 family protein [Synoicihabitans lomoniglobus]|uniref:DUF1961 family protein n=1 Tax=Synoicihabitans lomoniglobus TaxID=2909285 RepID=A0AAE9ZZF4_9BACT|nr:DUF1961 family protein [Opitutaceae bacterium LMO-M01]WED64213.1 DUF1961 family protein [Opitutaceae bacterium LMO-M01]
MLQQRFILPLLLLWGAICAAAPAADELAQRFAALLAAPTAETFFDPGHGDWRKHWQLDGEVGEVTTGPEGMTLQAGPDVGNNAHHVVLWTRQRFADDVRIDFDYVRLDHETRNVNILYLFASGAGDPPYVADLMAWRELRTVPRMSLYFDHVHAYHLSFAAFEMQGTDPAADYVRARRYRPDRQRGLEDTAMPPDYARTGLFAPGVPHHITVVRHGADLFMQVSNAEATRLFHWDTSAFPPMAEGHLGLRHMFGRSARYANFRVAQIPVE